MRRSIVIVGVAACLVLVAGMVAQARSSRGAARVGRATTLHVIEHATTDKVIDIGKAGDSTGDLLTFHNKVYDETDTSVAGKDQGECVRINPAKGTWECRWVTILDGGSITVEGPFYDSSDSTVAITGGTGAYAAARGETALHALDGGAKYDFIFSIEP